MSSSRYTTNVLNSSLLTVQELRDIWTSLVRQASKQEQIEWGSLTDEEFEDMLEHVYTIQDMNRIMNREKEAPTKKWSKLAEWSFLPEPFTASSSRRRRRFGGLSKKYASRKHKRSRKHNRRSRKNRK